MRRAFNQYMSSLKHASAARPASVPAPLLLCGALFVAILAACGGGGDTVTAPPPVLVNTGPGTTGVPDVSGFYTRVNNAGASTCDPQDPTPAGGTVQLTAFVDSQPIKLYQNGTKLTLAYTNYPQAPADSGVVDLAGKLTMGIAGTGSKENLRGTRQFYVDISGNFALTRPDASSPFTGPGSFQYVYHENSATAPVFTTCTRSITITFRKTGSI
jgi:hypothetical protein